VQIRFFPHSKLVALVAEDDLELARRGAVVGERGAVVRVGEGLRALALEELRVLGCAAGAGVVVHVAAAELVGAEGLAAALAGDDAAGRGAQLQLAGAGLGEVLAAGEDGAVAAALVRGHGQAHVEAVHQAHAVRRPVAAVVERDLRQRGRRRAAEPAALEPAAAVTRRAVELRARAGAARARPDAARPGVGRRGEGPVGERREEEAAALEDVVARVGLDAGPHGERAVVDDGQGHRGEVGGGHQKAAAAQEGGGEKEEKHFGRNHGCGGPCYLRVSRDDRGFIERNVVGAASWSVLARGRAW
jgi:hypothetical protein